MAAQIDELRTEVGAGSGHDTPLAQCLEVAEALLEEYTVGVRDSIPPVVYDKAHLAVAAELWHQRKAPNGVLNQQFMTPGGDSIATPIRIGRDPLDPARPLLEQWVISVGFA